MKASSIDTEMSIELARHDVCKEIRTLEATWEMNRMQKEQDDKRDVVDENLIPKRSRRYNRAS